MKKCANGHEDDKYSRMYVTESQMYYEVNKLLLRETTFSIAYARNQGDINGRYTRNQETLRKYLQLNQDSINKIRML